MRTYEKNELHSYRWFRCEQTQTATAEFQVLINGYPYYTAPPVDSCKYDDVKCPVKERGQISLQTKLHYSKFCSPGINTGLLLPYLPNSILRSKTSDFPDFHIMKLMATDTKPDMSTVVVQTASEPKTPEEAKEKRMRLKIILISVVVIVVVVIAAIVTVVVVVGKQAEDTIKTAMLPYKDESGKSSSQKVTVSSREEKFEIAGTGTAVFDFDKSLLAYKPDQMAKPTCFLTAANTSTLLSPEKMKSFLEDKTVSTLPSNSSGHAEYMSSGVVVPNKDFLSPMSKELCKDTEVIWMVPKPDCMDEKSLARRKRTLCYYYEYCYILYCDLCYCYYTCIWYVYCY